MVVANSVYAPTMQNTTPERRTVRKLSNGRHRVVAEVVELNDGRRVLEKKRLNPTKHQLRIPPAWAMESDHLDEARDMGVESTVFRDTEGVTWTASINDWIANGFKFNRGAGNQTGLALRYWTKTPSGDSTEPTPSPILPASRPRCGDSMRPRHSSTADALRLLI